MGAALVRRTSATLAALAVILGLLAVPRAAAATEVEGYLELSDGTQLRYTALLPDGDGPFPAVLQYSGYNNGNNPRDGTFGKMVDQVVAAGIAVVGVNLRGSGCSEGTFSPFSQQWATDGVEVVEWVADQSWSDGNVAMAGVSYPAILSLVTAVERPPSLRAIFANVPVVDLYPDVAYPGGMFNQTFASVWTVLQKYGTFFGIQETAEGDPQCALAWPAQNDPTDLTGIQAATNTTKDSLDRYTTFLQWEDLATIEVPALVYTAWQDEQLGSRAMHAYEFLDPDLRWVVASNGDHIGFAGSPWHQQLGLRFLEHFLRGGAVADFDVPRVQIPRDVRKSDASFDELDTYATYPVPTLTTTLFAQPDGSFALAAPDSTAAFTFNAPQPAPSVPVGIDLNVGFNPAFYSEAFKVPVPPGGHVAFTTPALADHLQVHGPLSLDTWISSTHDDADLQVTLTEVRPDGQELYVQRGWLRASHRALDPTHTTSTRPVHLHTADSLAPLGGDGPTAVRVEVWPVDHVFRAGSALRISIESPVGFTGFRQLQFDPAPARHTVHVGPDTPTRLVFGRIAAPGVTTERPACDTLLNMPCRPSPAAPPTGELRITPADDPAPGGGPAGGTTGPATPGTGGGAAACATVLLVLSLVAGRARRRSSRVALGDRT